jgi:hypothetical protein
MNGLCELCQKQILPTREVAEDRARVMRKRTDERVSAYRGPCGHWHLGGQRPPLRIRKPRLWRRRP